MSDQEMEPGRILLSRAKITARVRVLGREIASHYCGQPPVFLGVMNGALFFFTDLVRAIDLECEIGTVRLASYRGTTSTGTVRGLGGLRDAVRGRHILIIDDILETGRTLAALSKRLQKLGAAEIKCCVLLQKRCPRQVPAHADWIGFEIADEFVVGYGLDYQGRFRTRKDIRLLRKSR